MQLVLHTIYAIPGLSNGVVSFSLPARLCDQAGVHAVMERKDQARVRSIVFVELSFGHCSDYAPFAPASGWSSPSYAIFLTLSTAQAKAQARRQERAVAFKLKKRGLPSLSTEDIAVVFKQVYLLGRLGSCFDSL